MHGLEASARFWAEGLYLFQMACTKLAPNLPEMRMMARVSSSLVPWPPTACKDGSKQALSINGWARGWGQEVQASSFETIKACLPCFNFMAHDSCQHEQLTPGPAKSTEPAHPHGREGQHPL